MAGSAAAGGPCGQLPQLPLPLPLPHPPLLEELRLQIQAQMQTQTQTQTQKLGEPSLLLQRQCPQLVWRPPRERGLARAMTASAVVAAAAVVEAGCQSPARGHTATPRSRATMSGQRARGEAGTCLAVLSSAGRMPSRASLVVRGGRLSCLARATREGEEEEDEEEGNGLATRGGTGPGEMGKPPAKVAACVGAAGELLMLAPTGWRMQCLCLSSHRWEQHTWRTKARPGR